MNALLSILFKLLAEVYDFLWGKSLRHNWAMNVLAHSPVCGHGWGIEGDHLDIYSWYWLKLKNGTFEFAHYNASKKEWEPLLDYLLEPVVVWLLPKAVRIDEILLDAEPEWLLPLWRKMLPKGLWEAMWAYFDHELVVVATPTK